MSAQRFLRPVHAREFRHPTGLALWVGTLLLSALSGCILATPPVHSSVGAGRNGGDLVVHGLIGVQGSAPSFPDRTEFGAGYAFETHPDSPDGTQTLHGFYAVAGYRVVDALPHRVVASLRAEMLGKNLPEVGAGVRLSYGNATHIERERRWDDSHGAHGIDGELGWAVYVDARAARERFDGSNWTITAGLSLKLPVLYMICCIPH